jgi:hypothetical protein
LGLHPSGYSPAIPLSAPRFTVDFEMPRAKTAGPTLEDVPCVRPPRRGRDRSWDLGWVGAVGDTAYVTSVCARTGTVTRTWSVHLERKRVGFGGSRVWFRCPECQRPVGGLFLHAGSLACRHCHGARYYSQRTDRHARLCWREAKLRARLGGDGNLTLPPPPRPWKMWSLTYSRKVADIRAISERRYGLTRDLIEQLKRRCERRVPNVEIE